MKMSVFKVVYEQADRVQSNYTRYEKIAHAVKNGVWKPQKPDVEFEEFEFDRDQTRCRVLIGLVEDREQSKKHGPSIRDGKCKNYVF